MNSQRDPGMRKWPMAKPAMVARMTEAGTTPTTMITLDTSRASMWACSKASRKLPHWGSVGQDSPGGTVPDGCNAVVKTLRNGMRVTAMRATSSSLPTQTSDATDDHAGSSRVRRWMGRTVTSTSTTSTTARAEATPTLRPRKASR